MQNINSTCLQKINITNAEYKQYMLAENKYYKCRIYVNSTFSQNRNITNAEYKQYMFAENKYSKCRI